MIKSVIKWIGSVVKWYQNAQSISEIAQHLQEEWDHVIRIENALLKEKVWEKIPRDIAQKWIQIQRQDIEGFLKEFLDKCHSSHINTWLIGFETVWDKVTVFGGPVTLRLIRTSKYKILEEETREAVEDVQSNIVRITQ